ncbi:DUF2290 domain-containing protein [Alteriqipengyuania flavescens]|uniref:DUF2290 domain-containing protein n=1 Tax=Alteriqipengyuania flavescens TaxID=3053610 RepID=UPI0025B53A44|nr:DUF2290 domain-containing protein [Alteriqipengyuania flavescens]WJY17919.1 DUF2290 domain-containing protein [Alteriqipengyuania flavescens]WJY23860.1 DUF2290 domain-containing protein [Alteriqipengyuania flavescens]
MDPRDAIKEIHDLTGSLIATGLCVDQNYPSEIIDGAECSVAFGKDVDLSIVLKNVPYVDVYKALSERRAFNIKMIDGALIQFQYRFSGGDIQGHRLAFFPSPDLQEYQNDPEIYETDDLYADMIAKNVVTVPVRFDYDPDSFVDYEHPVSHLTLGQYKNCRIPVSGPVSPFIFLNFILRSFYNTPYRKFSADMGEGHLEFGCSISDLEKRHMHIWVSST